MEVEHMTDDQKGLNHCIAAFERINDKCDHMVLVLRVMLIVGILAGIVACLIDHNLMTAVLFIGLAIVMINITSSMSADLAHLDKQKKSLFIYTFEHFDGMELSPALSEAYRHRLKQLKTSKTKVL